MQSSDNPRSKGSSINLRVDELLSRILDKVEGSDDMLKEMKVDFSSLNGRVNSHADVIKQLEDQLTQISAQLEPMVCERGEADYDQDLAVVTQSEKIVVGKDNRGFIHEEEKDIDKEERLVQAPDSDMLKEKEESPQQSPVDELHKGSEKVVLAPEIMQPLPEISHPFPQRLKKKNEDEKFMKFLSVFKTLSINFPLVEALLEMSGYEKFMKELVTKKLSMDLKTIEVCHNCSAIMTSDMIIKKEDPGAFTIPCTIGMLKFSRVLCDLGVSINLMPYAIFKQLGLGEPKFTTMRLLMAYRSIKHPVGILYDILVPIVLGRLFLATARALVDVKSGELKFRVNEDEVTFNVCKSMKQPSDIHVVFVIDVIDEAVSTVSEVIRMSEPLEAVLSNYDEIKIQGYDEVLAALSGFEQPPKLELKAHPAHLRYAFLGVDNTLPVIITAALLEWQVKLLLEVLKSECIPSVEQQRRLNPLMQEVVKKEIIKWLDTSVVYPFAGSKWVSPMQCVPKKGGIVVVSNKKGKLVPTRPVTD
ncbi:hypothetical protein KY284_036190 [Solanum tuberosum]|nr:hypothetical protein KY284_036190 [Solanum tuberosum]